MTSLLLLSLGKTDVAASAGRHVDSTGTRLYTSDQRPVSGVTLRKTGTGDESKGKCRSKSGTTRTSYEGLSIEPSDAIFRYISPHTLRLCSICDTLEADTRHFKQARWALVTFAPVFWRKKRLRTILAVPGCPGRPEPVVTA